MANLFVLAGSVFAQSPLENAVTLARERHYEEAQQLLRDVSEPAVTSQRIAFHRLKAAIASGLKDSSTAAAEMRQALSLAPADSSLLLGTAIAELHAGQPDAALQHASNAGENATAKAIIGDVQEQRGNVPEALAAYRAAVQLDPTREDYRATLATALVRHQMYRSAIASLRVALPLFPLSARLLTLLGIAQYAMGEVEDGAVTLSAAINADPQAEPAFRSLAQIVLESSSAPPASIISQLCQWNRTVCSALKLRSARENNDAAMQAEAVAGLESAPANDAFAHCELARAREWSNRMADARREMEQCLAAFPSSRNHYRLGLIYQRLGLTLLAQKQMELKNQSADSLNVLKSLQ